MMKIENQINTLLQYFSPSYLDVINESYMHAVPKGSESHFKVIIVSNNFKGLRSVQRHQKTYKILDKVMKEIHALSIHTFTEDEWKTNEMNLQSPKCKGEK